MTQIMELTDEQKLTELAQLIGTLEFHARNAEARKETTKAAVYREHADALHSMVQPE